MYKKYSDKFGREVVTIFPGEYYITNTDEIISTVLGSCISVCLYDSINGVAGMNHFMLPVKSVDHDAFLEELAEPSNFYNNNLRYGTVAMETLIGELQKKGAERRYLKAKVFGGANIISTNSPHLSVGYRNIHFIRAYLAFEDIEIISQDVGKNYGRKIFFVTSNFKIYLKRLSSEHAQRVEKMAQSYDQRIQLHNRYGSIDLF